MAESYLTKQRHRKEELQLIDHPSGLVPWEVNFCLEYALCGQVLDAFKKVCTVNELSESDHTLKMKAFALLRKPLVTKYLKSLNARLEEIGVASIVELQSFLTDALRTPIADIDEHHPLCQKKITTTRIQKDGTKVERVTYESVSKMEAAKALIQMKGWAAPTKVHMEHSGGVMLVPMTSNVGDWEKLATESQQALMEDAIDI